MNSPEFLGIIQGTFIVISGLGSYYKVTKSQVVYKLIQIIIGQPCTVYLCNILYSLYILYSLSVQYITSKIFVLKIICK